MPIIAGAAELLDSVNVGDQTAVARVVRAAVGALMAAPALAEDQLPPGRRAWLEGFAARCIEGALLGRGDGPREIGLDELWQGFSESIIRRGVIPAVFAAVQTANDGDGQDERRGWASHAAREVDAFLRDDRDIRDLAIAAVSTRDRAVWSRYPCWFGSADDARIDLIAARRISAARWMPLSAPDDPVLRDLLADEVIEVRHVAAVRLAMQGGDIDDELRWRLGEAAADHRWIWSWRDHFERGENGCEVAMRLLTARPR